MNFLCFLFIKPTYAHAVYLYQCASSFTLTCFGRTLSSSGNLYLLTYSMVQSPSWEANWFAASQEIPRILWNPKVHYHTHKPPPPVPILGQPNPVHIPTSHLLEIRPYTLIFKTNWSIIVVLLITVICGGKFKSVRSLSVAAEYTVI